MKFPRLSLGTQLIVLLLVALVVAQAASFVVFTDDRQAAVRAAVAESTCTSTRSMRHRLRHPGTGRRYCGNDPTHRAWLLACR